jgi:hypothetical protein
LTGRAGTRARILRSLPRRRRARSPSGSRLVYAVRGTSAFRNARPPPRTFSILASSHNSSTRREAELQRLARHPWIAPTRILAPQAQHELSHAVADERRAWDFGRTARTASTSTVEEGAIGERRQHPLMLPEPTTATPGLQERCVDCCAPREVPSLPRSERRQLRWRGDLDRGERPCGGAVQSLRVPRLLQVLCGAARSCSHLLAS